MTLLIDQYGRPIPVPSDFKLAPPTEFGFSERETDPDETVYQIFQAFYSETPDVPRKLGLAIDVKPGWTMVTAQVPHGCADDVMLVFLRGEPMFQQGTRFALRVLPPLPEQDHATESAEDQGGKEAEGSQGDEGVL
jgi:hypothetical protein